MGELIPEDTVRVGDDPRWANAIFACLEKVEELAKTPGITKENAETAQILADTARKLESTG
mgnify:CR=1 FL=1